MPLGKPPSSEEKAVMVPQGLFHIGTNDDLLT